MRNGFEDSVLVADMVDLLGLDQLNFFHDFSTIIFGVLFVLNEFNPAERA